MGLACSKQSLPFWHFFRKKRCASPVWTYASLLHNTFSIPQNHAKVKGAAAPFFQKPVPKRAAFLRRKSHGLDGRSPRKHEKTAADPIFQGRCLSAALGCPAGPAAPHRPGPLGAGLGGGDGGHPGRHGTPRSGVPGRPWRPPGPGRPGPSKCGRPSGPS